MRSTIRWTDCDRKQGAGCQVRLGTRGYLKTLLENGKLHESGPFVDDSGALLIYDAADVAEVQELLANDPYAPAGIVASVSINEWNRVIYRDSAPAYGMGQGRFARSDSGAGLVVARPHRRQALADSAGNDGQSSAPT
jgi:uncharacterized protein YciI